MPNTIRVIARLVSKPDRVGDTRVTLEALIEPTRAENGCVTYELMQNNADPTDFTFVEEWESDDALDAHLASAHIEQLRSIADELLAAEPDVRRYTLIK